MNIEPNNIIIPIKNAYNFGGNIPLLAKIDKIIMGIHIITIVFINLECALYLLP